MGEENLIQRLTVGWWGPRGQDGGTLPPEGGTPKDQDHAGQVNSCCISRASPFGTESAGEKCHLWRPRSAGQSPQTFRIQVLIQASIGEEGMADFCRYVNQHAQETVGRRLPGYFWLTRGEGAAAFLSFLMWECGEHHRTKHSVD